MTDHERIAALEKELQSLRRLVEHIYFQGNTMRDDKGNLVPLNPETCNHQWMTDGASSELHCIRCQATKVVARQT